MYSLSRAQICDDTQQQGSTITKVILESFFLFFSLSRFLRVAKSQSVARDVKRNDGEIASVDPLKFLSIDNKSHARPNY